MKYFTIHLIKSLKHLLIILLFSFGYIQAQNFQLGFRVEENGIDLERYPGAGETSNGLLPTALQVNASIYATKYLSVEGRFSLEFALDKYQGGEYGICVKYFPISSVYAVGGIIDHSFMGEGHNSGEIYGKSVVMPAVGIGGNPFGAFHIEALYLFAGNKEIGNDVIYSYQYTAGVLHSFNTIKPIKLKSVFKLGFGFSWSL